MYRSDQDDDDYHDDDNICVTVSTFSEMDCFTLSFNSLILQSHLVSAIPRPGLHWKLVFTPGKSIKTRFDLTLNTCRYAVAESLADSEEEEANPLLSMFLAKLPVIPFHNNTR